MHRPNTRATIDREDHDAPRRRTMRATLPSSAGPVGAGSANPTARVDVLASNPAILAELLDRIAAVAREPGLLDAAANVTGGANPSPTASLHARLRVIATRCRRASLRITFEGMDAATTSPRGAATDDVGPEGAAASAREPAPVAIDWTSELTPVAPDVAPASGLVMHVASAERADMLPADANTLRADADMLPAAYANRLPADADMLPADDMPPAAATPAVPGASDADAEIEPQPDFAQAAFTLPSTDALDQFGPGPLAARRSRDSRSNAWISKQSNGAPETPADPGARPVRTVEHPSVSGSSMFRVVRVGPLLEMPERHPVRGEDFAADRPAIVTVLRDVATRARQDLPAAGAAAWSRARTAAAALAASSQRQVSRWRETLRSQAGRRPARHAPTPAWLSQPLWRVRRQSIVPTSVGLGAFFSVLIVGGVIVTRSDPGSTLAEAASTTAVSPLAQTTKPVAAASLAGSAGPLAAPGSAGDTVGAPGTPAAPAPSDVSPAQPAAERAPVALGDATTSSRASAPLAANGGPIAAATATSAPAAASRPRSADAHAASAAVGAAVPPRTPSARARRGGATFVGRLDITSTPPGATVSIDNRAVGTTPLTLTEVRAGTRAVRIEHDGFARWSRAVLVPADRRARVNAVLNPRP